MKKDKFAIGITFFLFLWVLLLLILSSTYDPKTRLFPILVGGFTFLCLLYVLLGDFFPKILKIFDVDALENKMESFDKSIKTVKGNKPILMFSLICAWLGGFFLTLYLLGFLITTPLFILIFIRGFRQEKWKNSIIASILITTLTHITFKYFFKLDLYNGIFWQ